MINTLSASIKPDAYELLCILFHQNIKNASIGIKVLPINSDPRLTQIFNDLQTNFVTLYKKHHTLKDGFVNWYQGRYNTKEVTINQQSIARYIHSIKNA